jgi:hypothetical protein
MRPERRVRAQREAEQSVLHLPTAFEQATDAGKRRPVM